MDLVPYFLGSGKASEAMKKSLAILQVLEPDLKIAPFRTIARGEPMPDLASDLSNSKTPVLFIANPHGLHAQAILDGVKAGFPAIVTEKPACVNLEEVHALKSVSIPVAVAHVYRQTWGIRTIRQMIEAGELGEIIALEGRYWQSSAAQRALANSSSSTAQSKSWKNDARLSGGYDTFLDLGTHWADLAAYLMGEPRFDGQVWLSNHNAEAPHRDTYVQAVLQFSGGRRAFGSISKTIHGAGNQHEWQVIGSKSSVAWSFLNPDELIVGRGGSRTTLFRQDQSLGSRQAAFHGMGWIEGYVEIIRALIGELKDGKPADYPTLRWSLEVLEGWVGVVGKMDR